MTTVDTRGMVMIHKVLRREFSLLPDLVGRATGRVERSALVGRHAMAMLDFLESHHQGEDSLAWPLLRERLDHEADLFDRMQSQHGAIEAPLACVRDLLPAWISSARAEQGEALAHSCEQLTTALLPHLEEEESLVLPLAATHLSQSEWDALAQHGFGAVPNERRVIMLGHILEEANEEERDLMYRQVPPPAREAFETMGRMQFEHEVAELRA
jgi:hemerythrin-like domain-containing protein